MFVGELNLTLWFRIYFAVEGSKYTPRVLLHCFDTHVILHPRKKEPTALIDAGTRSTLFSSL